MGSQDLKITRELDLRQTAQIMGRRVLAKAVNYEVDMSLDSGTIMLADNSSQPVWFFLPPANTCGGRFFTFLNANYGSMYIKHPAGVATNAITDGQICCELSVNTTHLINCLNFWYTTGNTGCIGAGVTLVSNNTKYLLFNHQVTNFRSFTEPK